MNWDAIRGNWKQFRGHVREYWGTVTDDQLVIIAGKRETLTGKIQQTYGMTIEEAEERVLAFAERYKGHRSANTV
jgi:uncharacterized protein YjbJ (UPF0337 family)